MRRTKTGRTATGVIEPPPLTHNFHFPYIYIYIVVKNCFYLLNIYNLLKEGCRVKKDYIHLIKYFLIKYIATLNL